MTFLIVDQCQERLQALSDQLRALFPDCPVILETDPLLAGDYCFSNPVDVLYAGWHMKWLDGPKLAAFARRGNPSGLKRHLTRSSTDCKYELLTLKRRIYFSVGRRWYSRRSLEDCRFSR